MKESQQHHSNKQIREYVQLQEKKNELNRKAWSHTEIHTHTTSPEFIETVIENKIVLKNDSKEDLERKFKKVWDFIAGKNTSILSK